MSIIPKEKCGTCAYFDPKGVCRKTRELVNYFDQKECYLASFDEPAKEEKEPTKVCKGCGRELPLSSFGGHARMKDGKQALCRECMGKRLKGSRKKNQTPAEPVIEEPKADTTIAATPEQPVEDFSFLDEPATYTEIKGASLESFSDVELCAELHLRGFRGQLVKTIKLGDEQYV